MGLGFRNNAKKAVARSYLEPLYNYYQQLALPTHDAQLIELFNIKKRFLSWEEYQNILNTFITTLDHPDFAFDILAESHIGNHGALGLAVLCGLNLKQAIGIVLKFYRIRSQLFELKQIDIADDKVCLQFDLHYPLNDVMRSTLELTMGTLHKSKKDIIGLAESNDVIYFSFPEPDYSGRYQEFFDCPVYFNQSHNRFVFPKPQLKQKLRFANTEAHDTLLNQCEQDLNQLEEGKDLVVQVSQQLQTCSDFPSLEMMADKIHISSRSLRRHLQLNHTSYQNLLMDERIRRAKILLVESNLSISDIAFKLGYSEAANFSKAFKKLAKETPATYRKKHIG